MISEICIQPLIQELRNPLASVRSLSEILHEEQDMDVLTRKRFLESMVQETDKLTRMINRFSIDLN